MDVSQISNVLVVLAIGFIFGILFHKHFFHKCKSCQTSAVHFSPTIKWDKICDYAKRGQTCRRGHCNFAHDLTNNTYHPIMRAIYTAKDSIDLCVYRLCMDDFVRTIIASHRRGVRVRVLIDRAKKSDQAVGSDNTDYKDHFQNLLALEKEGIKVLAPQTEGLMHHKFVIIDNEELIMGSMNWSYSGVRHNLEAILITRVYKIVKQFLWHFDRLWENATGWNVNNVPLLQPNRLDANNRRPFNYDIIDGESRQ